MRRILFDIAFAILVIAIQVFWGAVAVQANADVAVFSQFLALNSGDQQKAAEQLMRSGSHQLIFDSNDGAPIEVFNLEVPSNTEIIIKKGVTLTAKISASLYDNVFRIDHVSQVSIHGEAGARITAKKKRYATGEWRAHISILSSSDVEISGLTIENSGGDGIYVASSHKTTPAMGDFICRNIRIHDNTIDNNSRNGISVIQGRNIIIEHNIISNTRSEPNTKVASGGPHAGIDLEPNLAAEEIENIAIRNNSLIDNQAFGLILSLANIRTGNSTVNIMFDDNAISGSNIGIGVSVPILRNGAIVMNRNTISKYRRNAIWIADKSVKGPQLTIAGTQVDDTMPKADWNGLHAPLVITKANAAEADGNISIVQTYLNSNRGAFLFGVDNASLLPYENVSLGFILAKKNLPKKLFKGRGFNPSGFSMSLR